MALLPAGPVTLAEIQAAGFTHWKTILGIELHKTTGSPPVYLVWNRPANINNPGVKKEIPQALINMDPIHAAALTVVLATIIRDLVNASTLSAGKKTAYADILGPLAEN